MIYGFMLFLYLILMLLVGVGVSKWIGDAEDWWIAGRQLNIPLSVGTYFATIVSTVSVIGYLGYYYNIGWGGWWNWAGTALTTLIAAGWFAAKLRRFGKVTLPDFLEARYGKTQRTIGAIVILIATVFFTCAQLVGASVLINVATGIPINIAVVIVGVVFIIFTMLGGMFAVAWTDTISSAIILIGVWILMFVSLDKVGGFKQLHLTLAQTNPSALDPFAGGKMHIGIIISWILTWGIGNFGAPQFITRFYACKDEHVARMSQGWTGLTFMLFYVPVMLIALSGMVLIPGIAESDAVAPTLIKQLLHPVWGGVVMAGILAAAISTADSVLLLAGTTVTRDIYPKFINPNAGQQELLRLSRIVTVVIGGLAVFGTIFIQSTVMWIQATMVGILGSILAVPVILGFAWKRANSTGALAAMITGCITAIVWYVLGKPFGIFPILPSLITSVIAMVVGSLATAPPSNEIVKMFFAEEDIITGNPSFNG